MVLSVLAHIVRRRSMEKLERYRVQHEMKNAELALALVSEEEAREFAENSRHKLEAAIRTANRSQQRFRRLTEATFEGLSSTMEAKSSTPTPHSFGNPVTMKMRLSV